MDNYDTITDIKHFYGSLVHEGVIEYLKEDILNSNMSSGDKTLAIIKLEETGPTKDQVKEYLQEIAKLVELFFNKSKKTDKDKKDEEEQKSAIMQAKDKIQSIVDTKEEAKSMSNKFKNASIKYFEKYPERRAHTMKPFEDSLARAEQLIKEVKSNKVKGVGAVALILALTTVAYNLYRTHNFQNCESIKNKYEREKCKETSILLAIRQLSQDVDECNKSNDPMKCINGVKSQIQKWKTRHDKVQENLRRYSNGS